MQLSNILITLLAATTIAAGGSDGNGGRIRGVKNFNSTEPVSDQRQCVILEQAQHLVDLASNATRLADKTNNDPTKIAAIQAKASEAAATVARLEANATLVQTCAGILATEKSLNDCQRTGLLEKQAALAANDTGLAAKFDGDQARIDEFKSKAAENADDLAALQANSTLAAICAAVRTEGDCRRIVGLQKTVDLANNDTLLASKFDGDQAKIDQFKARAAEAQTELAAMQANSTLTSICEGTTTQDSPSKAAAETRSVSGSGNGSGNTGSAAVRSIESASGVIMAAVLGGLAVMFAL